MTTFNINQFAKKEISKEAVLKIKYVMETSYEDGSVWIGYTVNGNWGCEISYSYQDTQDGLDKVISDVKNGYLKIDDNEKISVENLINKPSLEICSSDLKELIGYCSQSENEMWFVEYDEIEEYGYDLEELEDEVVNLNIEKYFEFDNGDCAITVFGGISTKFLF